MVCTGAVRARYADGANLDIVFPQAVHHSIGCGFVPSRFRRVLPPEREEHGQARVQSGISIGRNQAVGRAIVEDILDAPGQVENLCLD